MVMEELFEDNKLGELEEKIDVLLQTYTGIREEKADLAGKVASLETENRELKALVAKIETEKEMVMQKVKGILDKIQKMEA